MLCRRGRQGDDTKSGDCGVVNVEWFAGRFRESFVNEEIAKFGDVTNVGDMKCRVIIFRQRHRFFSCPYYRYISCANLVA